jgi:GT2 family glycosyltransferase
VDLPDAPLPPPSITAAIATRDRPDALVRCLRSLRLLDGLMAEAIVVDDGSRPPAKGPALAALAADLPPPVRFIRNETSISTPAARNVLLREARTPWVLLLDDDAFVVSRESIEAALRVLETDDEVASVAFAQADVEGNPFPPAAQPAPVDYPCYVPAFIGFGHLVRREAFLRVGGFRETLATNGEEKEVSLRLLDAGYRVVYLPDAVVAHVADQAGRDARRYLHQTVRNTTLSALYDEPFPVVFAGAALRLWRYFPMRKGWQIHDPGGFGRLVRGIARDLPAIWRDRTPVRRSTWKQWRAMTTAAEPEPYRPPAERVADVDPIAEPA